MTILRMDMSSTYRAQNLLDRKAYISYVSQSNAQSLGLAAVQSDGTFLMRADAEETAAGRGRNSVRISSKDKFNDVSGSLPCSRHCS